MRIRPRLGACLVIGKRFDDRRAAAGLNGNHAWPRAANPTHFFELAKCFPHADESRATAGGIDNHIRQAPIELLCDFVAHGFLAFDSIGLFQRRDIEPAFRGFPLGDDPAAFVNQTIDEGELGAVLRDFDLIGRRRIARHEHVGFYARARRIGRKRSAGVAGRRNRGFSHAELFRP